MKKFNSTGSLGVQFGPNVEKTEKNTAITTKVITMNAKQKDVGVALDVIDIRRAKEPEIRELIRNADVIWCVDKCTKREGVFWGRSTLNAI